MIDNDTRDRAEIYDLFNRYADAVAGLQWGRLDEVFTEDVTSAWPGSPEIEGRAALVRRIRDVIERNAETHLLGNYTATIDGDVAEASVRVRVHQLWAGVPSRFIRRFSAPSGRSWSALAASSRSLRSHPEHGMTCAEAATSGDQCPS